MNSSLLRSLGVMILFSTLAMTLVAGGDDEKGKGKAKGKGKGKGQSEIVQVDLSKLHPGIAMYIRDHLQGQGKTKGKGDEKKKMEDKKGKGKEQKGQIPPIAEEKKKGKGKDDPKKGAMEISLGDAIRIAEKSGNGTVTKAERGKKSDAAAFSVELTNEQGARTKLNIDSAGRILNPSTATDSPKKKKKD